MAGLKNIQKIDLGLRVETLNSDEQNLRERSKMRSHGAYFSVQKTLKKLIKNYVTLVGSPLIFNVKKIT